MENVEICLTHLCPIGVPNATSMNLTKIHLVVHEVYKPFSVEKHALPYPVLEILIDTIHMLCTCHGQVLLI